MSRFALLALLVVASATGICQGTDDPATLNSVEASVNTAGPYGEYWRLKIAKDGKASIHYSHRFPTGSMDGEFLLDREHWDKIVAAARANRFADLNAELYPASAPFHAPDYMLSLRFGNTSKKVRAYHPSEVVEKGQLQRFWAVWDAAWSGMPLRPQRGERANSALQPTR